MTVDRNKGVQWVMDVTPEFPVIPLTIFKTNDTQSTPPEIIYSGPFNADIVPALALHGYVYNYDPEGSPSNPDNFLMYGTNADTSYLLIVAGEVTMGENGLVFTSDEFQNKLMFNSGIKNNVSTAFELVDREVGGLGLQPLEQPYTGVATAIECLMENAEVAPPEPIGPAIVLISNPTENHFGVEIGVPSNVAATLNGPQGGSSVIDGGIAVCLSPIQTVESTIESDTTKCVKMEGLFAIEINGEMVPYHFSEKDLTKFFNASNPYGIQFLDCNAPIACVPTGFSFDWQDRESMDGGWALNYSFNDGPILRWEQIDMQMTHPRDLFDNAMWDIFNTPGSIGTLVTGGGGYANFQNMYGSIYGGEGGPLDTPIKLTFHRMTDEYGGVDLFDWFFDLNGSMQSLDIMSCGEQEWPGV